VTAAFGFLRFPPEFFNTAYFTPLSSPCEQPDPRCARRSAQSCGPVHRVGPDHQEAARERSHALHWPHARDEPNNRLEATPPRPNGYSTKRHAGVTVARGTVVGWAPRRDTGSTRRRWWGDSRKGTPGRAPGSRGIPPADPATAWPWGHRDGGAEAWRLSPSATCSARQPPHLQSDESGNAPDYVLRWPQQPDLRGPRQPRLVVTQPIGCCRETRERLPFGSRGCEGLHSSRQRP
jgi:hypothetical protein